MKFSTEEAAAEFILDMKFLKSDQSETTEEVWRQISNESEEAERELVTKEEVEGIIKKLNNKKAPGIDGTNNKGLKISHKKHPKILTDLYNACMKHGIFSACWKVGKVVLIPKRKGKKEDVDSYRPLTLLPAIGKVLEKVILSRIERKCEEYLSDKQYGFRKKRSCERR